MKSEFQFDVIVIGAGHAGCEAAHASARMGSRTLLLTQNLDTIGQMSCNPAIGGLGKGHLVREVDALGGIMGLIADRSGIQFRLLNRRKGPAVRGPRAQMDKMDYRRYTRSILDQTKHLELRQGEATGLIVEGDRVKGVTTDWGDRLLASSVVLTTGTFLRGLAHIGTRTFSAGRLGDSASQTMTDSLLDLGLNIKRLKTGTPPRLDGNTIDFSKCQPQPGDEIPVGFSFLSQSITRKQVPCHITYTNPTTHDLIRNNLDRAPLFSGQIKGIGPRYCPSIEDKVVRFSDRDRHQLFLEPEGIHTNEIYPNGISTSLPIDIQWEVIQSIEGLEQCRIIRPGYAIEYDMVDPRQLNEFLGVKGIDGLYLAGQINGTTGYEEAAAQGLIAGTEASLYHFNRPFVSFDRSESYMGVMVDDLITQGVDEPYRMFTSRAEFRLLLRIDNADSRLTPKGRALGLVDDVRWQVFETKRERTENIRQRLKTEKFKVLEQEPVKTGWQWLRQNELDQNVVMQLAGFEDLDSEISELLRVEARYEGYLSKQLSDAKRFKKAEQVKIPPGFLWEEVPGLSIEVRQKLIRVSPSNLGQANRIPGMTPAAIALLMVYLEKQGQVFP